ncbi:MAG: deoxyguanosinetriphosphate triphosphohydrolase [Clostridia bacterium]|nr:deoxyguanosinetriphosphate triphosphohydrolase [Clostridia bacterium]
MTVREMLEKRERETLSIYAALSEESKGREKEITPCDLRTDFQRDRDKIIYTKAFRRLKHKTQVFIAPLGDHYRTRLTHTLEVGQIARSISRALFLNEDLTEAISMGHDLGHTPFGHAGERALAELTKSGFRHNEQSLRIVKYLEGGSGINLTYEVMDGILNHVGPSYPETLEGRVCRLADKIAYINHDIDDACRAGILTEEALPFECTKVLGHSHGKRIDTIVRDCIKMSGEDIILSAEVYGAMMELEKFMFANVYLDSEAKTEEKKVFGIVKALYEYFMENHTLLKDEPGYDEENPEISVCDYISGMTDVFCVYKYNELFVPESWHKR